MMLSTSLFRLTPPLSSSLTRKQRHGLGRFAEGVSLWLAVLLMLFVHPLYAEASQEGAEPAGVLHFTDDAGQWQEQALILDSQFDIQVSGLIAESHLSRSFRNTSDRWREGVFVFPLPENASVYGLTMKIGERTIVGKIKPKAEAKKTYERAKASGKQAANVEQQRPNLFTAKVANIPPGESITVELQYQQPVEYRAGEFSLRLPTTLTPRYMPGQPLAEQPQQWKGGWSMATTEVPDAGAISPYTVRAEDVPATSHRANVHITINAGMPLGRVFSPTHALDTRIDGQTIEVQPEGGQLLMDRDFVVRWQALAGKEPTAAVFHQHWQDQDYLLAMIVPGIGQAEALPRELVFVIDTSGSMAGEPIRQAKTALQRGMDTLTPADTFNVIQFNSQAQALFMQPQVANGNNLARAHRYVEGLQANGGTEMAPALTMALESPVGKMEQPQQRVQQVVFITDGAVGNEAALFEQIRRQLNNKRLFTVGIGSAPNMHFMREAARWGRGIYTAIQDTSDVGGPLKKLFAAMKAPVLTDIQVQWPDQTDTAESFPARPGDLFQGEPLIQVVRGVTPAGSLKISGRLPNGQNWTRSLDLQQAAEGHGLNRQWARQKIDGLLDEERIDGKDQRSQVTSLAVEYNLMSPYTSFVAVDETPVRPADKPVTTENLPTLQPAGTTNGMLRYPQTGTIAPLLTALGVLGLMFSLAILMLQRRVFA